MSRKFTLASGISLAQCGNLFVFLDEGRDRYLALTSPQCDLFRRLGAMGSQEIPDARARAFADHLLSLGLLCETSSAHPIPEAPGANALNASSRTDLRDDETKVTPRQVMLFVFGLTRCWYLDRFSSLSLTLDKARQWKKRASNGQEKTDATLVLARAFHVISPFFISTHDACRFRSLLLFRFLTSQGATADWVFGVRTAPFAAHCWIESRSIVLNDRAENTDQYTEILRI